MADYRTSVYTDRSPVIIRPNNHTNVSSIAPFNASVPYQHKSSVLVTADDYGGFSAPDSFFSESQGKQIVTKSGGDDRLRQSAEIRGGEGWVVYNGEKGAGRRGYSNERRSPSSGGSSGRGHSVDVSTFIAGYQGGRQIEINDRQRRTVVTNDDISGRDAKREDKNRSYFGDSKLVYRDEPVRGQNRDAAPRNNNKKERTDNREYGYGDDSQVGRAQGGYYYRSKEPEQSKNRTYYEANVVNKSSSEQRYFQKSDRTPIDPDFRDRENLTVIDSKYINYSKKTKMDKNNNKRIVLESDIREVITDDDSDPDDDKNYVKKNKGQNLNAKVGKEVTKSDYVEKGKGDRGRGYQENISYIVDQFDGEQVRSKEDKGRVYNENKMTKKVVYVENSKSNSEPEFQEDRRYAENRQGKKDRGYPDKTRKTDSELDYVNNGEDPRQRHLGKAEIEQGHTAESRKIERRLQETTNLEYVDDSEDDKRRVRRGGLSMASKESGHVENRRTAKQDRVDGEQGIVVKTSKGQALSDNRAQKKNIALDSLLLEDTYDPRVWMPCCCSLFLCKIGSHNDK